MNNKTTYLIAAMVMCASGTANAANVTLNGPLTYEFTRYMVSHLDAGDTINLRMGVATGGDKSLLEEILRALPNGTLNTTCEKTCGSAAAVLWAASNTRVLAPNAELVFHLGHNEFGEIADTARFQQQYNVHKLMNDTQWGYFLKGFDIYIDKVN